MPASDERGLTQEGREAIWRSRYLSARRGFHSDAEMAEALGLDASQVEHWKSGHAPSPEDREKLVAVDVVVELLSDFLEQGSVSKWLEGHNAHLGGARPIDLLKNGRLPEVIDAIQAEKTVATRERWRQRASSGSFVLVAKRTDQLRTHPL